MSRLLDKIVIIDVESTCWEGTQPADQQSDIIEIGICLLDVQTGDITDSRGIMVKPERSTVSPFCTQLTTITQDMVDEGITFREACEILRSDYLTHQRTWMSYGQYDHTMFTNMCRDLKVPFPFGMSYINVKNLFGLKMKLKREVGMAGALALLNIPLEGTHHRGVDDARNIAKVVKWILCS